MSIDGFSMRFLAHELNETFSGGRIDRVFQPNRHTLLLSIRQPGKTLTLHISINPQNPVINQTTRTFDNPPTPPMFCMALRKQLEDGRIAAIAQSGLDRILFIHIDTIGNGGLIVTKTLAVELMGKHSNAILVTDGIIVDALRKIGIHENRFRQILPTKPYCLPPHQNKLHILETTTAQWITRLKEYPDLPIAKALIQAYMGIGPVSAHEIAWRTGLPETLTVAALDEADYQALCTTIEEIIESLHNHTAMPTAIIDPSGKLSSVAAFALEHCKKNDHIAHTFANVSEMIEFTTLRVGAYVPPDKERFTKLLISESAKAVNKQGVLTQELEEAAQAELFKTKADILMTYQHQIENHTNSVDLPNIYTDDPERNKLTITLDPLLSPMQNMQKYYQKYNKLKRAQSLLRQQLEQCEEDIRYLATIESSLQSSTTAAAITDIKNELIAAGYLKETSRRKSQEKPSEPLKFSFEDTVILVGRNNYQNDRLTFKISSPSDIWLHAKDIPGSHVIIRSEKNAPSADLLTFAAQLAAYFSKSRGSSNIPIDYAKRQYVKKPSGAKPGFVIYTNQKTIYVTPDCQAIEQLVHHQ